jgi:hypothetical protein
MNEHLRNSRIVDCFFGNTTIGGYRVRRGIAYRCRLSLLIGALGLLIFAPGPAWALSGDAAACRTPDDYPLAGFTIGGNEGQPGRSASPCLFLPTVASDATDASPSPLWQTQSTDSPSSSSNQDQGQQSNVNPITGLAEAPTSNYTPLTGSERWKLYIKMTYGSAGPYLSPLVNAALLDQTNGTPRQWGGGFAGFGRRLASRAGNAILQGTFQAPLAALLHEDVRYIPTTQHTVGRRALHAILYSFLTYNDHGHPTLNVANLTAFYASTAVTTAWLPGIGNPAKYTLTNASEQIALSFPLNVVQEFWPEIRRYIFRRH